MRAVTITIGGYLVFAVPLVIWDLACRPGVPLTSGIGPCWLAWLHPWQALSAGVLAVLAGGFAIWSARMQIRAAETHRKDDLADKKKRLLKAVYADAFHVQKLANDLAAAAEHRAVNPIDTSGAIHHIKALRIAPPPTLAAGWDALTLLDDEVFIRADIINKQIGQINLYVNLILSDIDAPDAQIKMEDPFGRLQYLYNNLADLAGNLVALLKEGRAHTSIDT